MIGQLPRSGPIIRADRCRSPESRSDADDSAGASRAMRVRRAPVRQAMQITTGSGTSAKPGRLRSSPGAWRLTGQRANGLSAERRPVPGPLVACQLMRKAALAGVAGASRGGTPRRLARWLTCKLAPFPLMPSPLMRQPGAGSDVPPSARALAIPIRGQEHSSQEHRSQERRARAGRVTRTLRLRRRPPRRPRALPGHSRAGRSRAGRSRAGHRQATA